MLPHNGLRPLPRCPLPPAASAPQSPDFWVLVAALVRFIDREGQGQLPLEVR